MIESTNQSTQRPSVAPATMTMGWNHPRHGRVLEVLCAAHERDVLGALTLLGIGCIGERLLYTADCTRCVAVASGISSRYYVTSVGEAARASVGAPEEYGDPFTPAGLGQLDPGARS